MRHFVRMARQAPKADVARLCDRRPVLLRRRRELRARAGADTLRSARAAHPAAPRAVHRHDRVAGARRGDRKTSQTRRRGARQRSQ